MINSKINKIDSRIRIKQKESKDTKDQNVVATPKIKSYDKHIIDIKTDQCEQITIGQSYKVNDTLEQNDKKLKNKLKETSNSYDYPNVNVKFEPTEFDYNGYPEENAHNSCIVQD